MPMLLVLKIWNDKPIHYHINSHKCVSDIAAIVKKSAVLYLEAACPGVPTTWCSYGQ